MWSCLLFIAATAVLSVFSASLWEANGTRPFKYASAPAPFSSSDTMAWMILAFLWFLWHFWLVLCFMDFLHSTPNWESQELPIEPQSTKLKLSESLETSMSRWFRKTHLWLSPTMCCSRRNRLECSKCLDLYLTVLASARQSGPSDSPPMAVVLKQQKEELVFEGERISSGRVLCGRHLCTYYDNDNLEIEKKSLYKAARSSCTRYYVVKVDGPADPPRANEAGGRSLSGTFSGGGGGGGGGNPG
jgi:hypothetical protein